MSTTEQIITEMFQGLADQFNENVPGGLGSIPPVNPPNSRDRSGEFPEPFPFDLQDLNTQNPTQQGLLLDIFRLFRKRRLEKLGNWVTFDEQQERKDMLKTLKRSIKRIKMDKDKDSVLSNQMDRILLMEEQIAEQLNIKSVF